MTNQYTQRDIQCMKETCLLCDNAECGYKVGCTIITEDDQKITSWNARLNGNSFCVDGMCIREVEHLQGGKDIHKVCSIHAEAHAIAQAAYQGIALNNAIMYVSTFPCLICAKLIIVAGIKSLYFMSPYMGEDHASPLFKGAGISVIQIPEAVVWE